MKRRVKETRQKVKVGAKEPQVVRAKVYPDGGPDFHASVAGNDVCRECGGCCEGGRHVWIGYYSERRVDYRKAMRLAREHPWFRKMWNVSEKIRERYAWRDRRATRKRSEKWRCDMLEKRGKLYSCRIHRLIGFSAKPKVCREHSCSKLRRAMEKSEGGVV